MKVLRLAGRAGAPVVGFIESGGARMQEGTAALAGYARIFRANAALSGRVPQISVITGTSAGGGSYSPALTDFVIMTREAAMFLTGPGVVREVMGEDVGAAELGGTGVHERNGVCHCVAEDSAGAIALARELLAYLPQSAWSLPEPGVPEPPATEDPGAVVPSDQRRVYDVREVMDALVDAGRHVEIAPRWARNIVCAFARIEGRPVGVVANQPRMLGGVLDADSATKAARFVRTCDTYGLPLIVLVDTPGFLPGTRQERGGVIRHGAKLLHAFAEATVPRLTVVLRKAYGGAYITMNSKDLGAHFSFAWPSAQIGVMGAEQAIGIVRRRELADADDPDAVRSRLAAEYADEHLSAAAAAREGFVDEVIDPVDTRARLAWGLSSLPSRDGRTAQSGNIPL